MWRFLFLSVWLLLLIFLVLFHFFLLFSFLFGCLEATNALGVAFSIYYLQKRLHCELTMVISVLLSLWCFKLSLLCLCTMLLTHKHKVGERYRKKKRLKESELAVERQREKERERTRSRGRGRGKQKQCGRKKSKGRCGTNIQSFLPLFSANSNYKRHFQRFILFQRSTSESISRSFLINRNRK